MNLWSKSPLQPSNWPTQRGQKPLPPEAFGDHSYFTAAEERYEFDESTIYLSPAPLYHAAPLGFTGERLKIRRKTRGNGAIQREACP